MLLQDWTMVVLNFMLDGEDLTIVARFIYFGSYLTKQGCTVDGVSMRISKAGGLHAGLRHLWCLPDIPLKLEDCVYCVAMRSVVLYGC